MATINIDDRYSRQLLLSEIGEIGQERLKKGAVLVVGCGALGSTIAQMLVRAGVGFVRVADRDVIEESNLHRQILYNEDDVASRLPKAEAAARNLKKINSHVEVEGKITNVTPRNVESLIADVDIVLDGTDNIETRYVVNDACVKHAKPWIYGGAVGTAGMMMSVVPNTGPCLRCLFPDPPKPGSLPTCDTVGVLGMSPVIIGALQATEGIRLLLGDYERAGQLVRVDAWRHNAFAAVDIPRQEDCKACGKREFEFLKASGVAWVTTLCGRNAVQITPPKEMTVDLEFLKAKLDRVSSVHYNGLTLTFELEGHEIVAFPDGRVMVKGTTDETWAIALRDRYIG